jgi:hypothetical protein
MRIPIPGRGRALPALLAGLAAWGSWFVWKTSFVIGGRRVFCLQDDAMISMAYARNLVTGHGLNWARQGQPVEGFTHPLWMALMVPVNLLPLPLDRRALAVQLLSLALLLWNVVLVRRLMLRHFCRPGACHWLPACVMTAFYYPLNAWALVGMETGLQALLTTASVLLALDIVDGRRDRHLALWLLGALAVLLRLDMILVVAAVQLYVVARGGLRVQRGLSGSSVQTGLSAPAGRGQGERAGRGDPAGRRLDSSWLTGMGCLLLAVGGYAVFRWFYFHDLLPNTYFLKLGGIPLWLRLLRGRNTMLDTWRAHGPLLAAVGIGLGVQLLRPRRRRDPEWEGRLALPACIFLLCCAYSVWVGGDVWEDQERANRFVAFAVPQLFVLFNAFANQALSALRRHPGAPPPWLLRLGLFTVTLAAFLSANGMLLRREAAGNWVDQALVVPQWDVHDHERILRRVRRLARIADPSAVVAVVWAGIPAYFSDWKMVDELGYNDRHIAHLPPVFVPARDSWRDYRPGHMKWDYGYVVEVCRPDVVFQMWETTREAARAIVRLLRSHGYRRVGDLWIDSASRAIHLDRR